MSRPGDDMPTLTALGRHSLRLPPGRSASALLGLTRLLVWLAVVVVASAVVSLAVGLIR